MWVSSITKGVDYHINQQSSFKHYYHKPIETNSLSFNTVSCFFEDSKGDTWVGTDGGGLNLFNKEDETFRHFTMENSNLGSNAVLSILEDSYGNLWVGTWEGGLNLLDRNTFKFKQYNHENSDLSCNNVISIIEDKDSVLWVGTFWCDGGINKFNRETGKFTSYTSQNSGLSDNVVFTMFIDSRDRFWVGTINGLSYLDKSENEFKSFLNDLDDSTSISQVTIFNVLESADSTIWIGTANGLNKFNYENGTFTRYYDTDGLPHNYITCLEEDDRGNLWIGTHNGLGRFNPKNNKHTNYKILHGLQGDHFYRCSHYKAPDGAMYFGGTNGFNVFNPEEIKDIEVILPLFFTDFKLFNQSVNIGENSPLKKDISLVETLLLNHKQNSFTLQFSAINYTAPEETSYEYILEGFDKNWIDAENIGTASYTNMDPGKYNFKVRIPYNSGIVNKEGISVSIIIKPPFWQTWWFRALLIIFIVTVLLGIYTYRMNAVKKINKQLEILVTDRTQELKEKNSLLSEQTEALHDTNVLLEERQQQVEEQAEELMSQRDDLADSNQKLEEYNATKDKFFSIIAHDIKNPFNTLLGFTDLLKDRYKEWSDQKRIEVIDLLHSTSENTFQLLENLLQWSRSQQGVIEFRPIEINLQLLIENTLELLKENAEQKNVHLSYSLKKEVVDVYADEQMLQTIIRNLISNAIKFSNSGGHVKVLIEKDNSNIIIHVQDDGVGMTTEAINNLFKTDSNRSTKGTNNEGGTGLGLILVKEFVLRHNGDIKVQSTPGEGSRFSVFIPL